MRSERYREECREAHRVHWFDELSADVRFGLRTLRKAPVFSATAIRFARARHRRQRVRVQRFQFAAAEAIAD